MADGKINRPYGGVLLLGIFLTPLLSLGHDYADGIITAKYFRFAEVVGIGLLLTWMVAWKRNFQFCFRWVDVGVVLFALYGVGSFLLNDFRGETQTLLLILLVGLYFCVSGFGRMEGFSEVAFLPLFYCSPGASKRYGDFYRYTVGLINTIAYTA